MPPSFSPTDADSDLIASLHLLSSKSPKLVKSSTYPAPADPSIIVRSWKMNEFKYYDIPSPFPTLARGLFTREVTDEADAGGKGKKYQIVVRGYDKFFNIGEVPWTTWSSLEAHTAPPYTLSLKSNGCIIFIAALTPSKLIVTSKHSLGPVNGVETSHAQAGEAWLRKYLEGKGRAEAELAGVLWERGWTAIAELCDDSFEEHVLGYPPEKTGLHLHGLNARSKDFITQPHDVVDAFAEEWGFIKTLTKTVNSIQEVKDFTTACAERGEWNGEPVEGFVVRTVVTEPPTSGRGSNDKGKGKEKEKEDGPPPARSPYKPNSSFFFKVKFDEPYMMYRDWREVTKSLLSQRAKNPGAKLDPSSLPKSKMRRAETKVYVKWVVREIGRDPGAFAEYNKGKGIISTRERFLRWLETGEGKGGLEEAGKEEKEGKGKEFGKTVIVPVAIPGCGKTAVSVALAHIFGFGHTQSDDVQAKKPAPVFIENVVNLLSKHDVVIADKNNHLTQHRKALRDATAGLTPPVRLLALDWSAALNALPPATAHRICSDRIAQRGANHQSLRVSSASAEGDVKKHEEVVWMFINTGEELSASEVDGVIEMTLDEAEGVEAQVRRAVRGVVDVLGVEEPSEEKVREALGVVGAYRPSVIKPDEPKGGKTGAAAAAASGSGAGAVAAGGSGSGKSPRYFGLLPEIDITALLDARLGAEKGDVPPGMRAFWEGLKKDGRVVKRPHVTIVHKNSTEGGKSNSGNGNGNGNGSGNGGGSENGSGIGGEETKRVKEVKEAKELWDRCAALHAMTNPAPPLFQARLGKVVCDGRVMAVTFEELGVASSSSSSASSSAGSGAVDTKAKAKDGPGEIFISKLPEEVKQRLHITVGTKTGSIQAVEAKAMVEALRKNGSGSGSGGGAGGSASGTGNGRKKAETEVVSLDGVAVYGRVKGLFG